MVALAHRRHTLVPWKRRYDGADNPAGTVAGTLLVTQVPTTTIYSEHKPKRVRIYLPTYLGALPIVNIKSM